MMELNSLRFVSMGEGLVERSNRVDPWIRSCWGDILDLLNKLDCFD